MDSTTDACAECADLSLVTEDAREALDHLLSKASTALEHDRETAEACIMRAAAMLGVTAEPTSIERETLAPPRGGWRRGSQSGSSRTSTSISPRRSARKISQVWSNSALAISSAHFGKASARLR
jgi:hypothetical protein